MPVSNTNEISETSGRTCRLDIRLTTKEREQLKRLVKKSGQNLSDYCRGAILRVRDGPVVEVDTSLMPDALRQLKGCATNLNQLARAVNAYGLSIDSVPALNQAAQEVKRASSVITEILSVSRK